jgi:hypothetical protein
MGHCTGTTERRRLFTAAAALSFSPYRIDNASNQDDPKGAPP